MSNFVDHSCIHRKSTNFPDKLTNSLGNSTTLLRMSSKIMFSGDMIMKEDNLSRLNTNHELDKL